VHGTRDWRTASRNGLTIRYVDRRGRTYCERLYKAFTQFSGSPYNEAVIIDQTGHMLPLEAADQLACVINRFTEDSAAEEVPVNQVHQILTRFPLPLNRADLGLRPIGMV
jgi:hypothetical protein